MSWQIDKKGSREEITEVLAKTLEVAMSKKAGDDEQQLVLATSQINKEMDAFGETWPAFLVRANGHRTPTQSNINITVHPLKGAE